MPGAGNAPIALESNLRAAAARSRAVLTPLAELEEARALAEAPLPGLAYLAAAVGGGGVCARWAQLASEAPTARRIGAREASITRHAGGLELHSALRAGVTSSATKLGLEVARRASLAAGR
eukprot:scaffold34637_cov112-Isochrysis_galbana.AAC.1